MLVKWKKMISIRIRIRISPKKLINWSSASLSFCKIWFKSVNKFLKYPAHNTHTHTHTHTHTTQTHVTLAPQLVMIKNDVGGGNIGSAVLKDDGPKLHGWKMQDQEMRDRIQCLNRHRINSFTEHMF